MFKHLLGGSSESVKARGPEAYQESPAHEFFTRVWRPLAVSINFLYALFRVHSFFSFTMPAAAANMLLLLARMLLPPAFGMQ